MGEERVGRERESLRIRVGEGKERRIEKDVKQRGVGGKREGGEREGEKRGR